VGHPECRPDVQECADFLGSSTETVEHCKNTETNEFLVADEVGSMDSLKTAIPHKTFHSITEPMVCPGMKKAELRDVLNVLETEKNRVTIQKNIAANAKMAIDLMFELS
jgi:quinolinate synthase